MSRTVNPRWAETLLFGGDECDLSEASQRAFNSPLAQPALPAARAALLSIETADGAVGCAGCMGKCEGGLRWRHFQMRGRGRFAMAAWANARVLCAGRVGKWEGGLRWPRGQM